MVDVHLLSVHVGASLFGVLSKTLSCFFAWCVSSQIFVVSFCVLWVVQLFFFVNPPAHPSWEMSNRRRLGSEYRLPPSSGLGLWSGRAPFVCPFQSRELWRFRRSVDDSPLMARGHFLRAIMRNELTATEMAE